MNTSAGAWEDFPALPALQKLVEMLRTRRNDAIKWQD
jgi:hypothetical protein